MTSAPMRRSASRLTAAARSAVGSIVTTFPRLPSKMFLTNIAASLVPAADNDPPRGWVRQESDSAVRKDPTVNGPRDSGGIWLPRRERKQWSAAQTDPMISTRRDVGRHVLDVRRVNR